FPPGAFTFIAGVPARSTGMCGLALGLRPSADMRLGSEPSRVSALVHAIEQPAAVPQLEAPHDRRRHFEAQRLDAPAHRERILASRPDDAPLLGRGRCSAGDELLLRGDLGSERSAHSREGALADLDAELV